MILWPRARKVLAIYETEDGQRPFKRWLESLKDKTTVARINARIARVEAGNFGDTKALGEGVSELRLAFGSGYRVYFGNDGVHLIILLSGGDKSTQDRDILTAKAYWADYLRRTKNG